MIGQTLARCLSSRHVALAPWLAFLLWANIETPMWADDYCRALSPSVVDAIAGAWHTYFNWSGRFFTTAITSLLMGTGWRWSMLPFDVANALIAFGMILLAQRLAALASASYDNGRNARTQSAADALLVALLLWWAPRSVAEVVLWKTGAIGYLWTLAGELLVLERALTLLLRREAPPPLWLAAPFAFVIATFLEPISALMSALLMLLALQAWRARRPTRWLAWVAAAHVAGSMVLIGAPGNFARAAIVARASGPSSIADRLSGVVGALSKVADGYTGVAVLLVLLPLVVPRRWSGSASGWSGRWPPVAAGCGWMFGALALGYTAILVAIPADLISARVTYPGSVFVACYLAALFRLRPVAAKTERAAIVALGLLTVATFAHAVPLMRDIAATDRAWTATLASQPKGASVTLPMIRGRHGSLLVNKDRFFAGFSDQAGYFVNVCYARAWGMARIVGQ